MNAGMMKSTFCMLQCSILSLMSVLAGCNSEVFIDEFLTDSPTVSLSETENEVTVRFDTDNWSIVDINYLRSDMSVFVTDLEGKIENRFRLKRAKPVLCIAKIPFWIFRW